MVRHSILFIVLFALWDQLCWSKTISVNPSTGLAAALASCVAGDVLQLSSGTYSGNTNCNLVLNSNYITIVGIEGAAATIVECVTTRCFTIAGSDITVSGITFQNGIAPNTPVSVSASLRGKIKERNLPQRFRSTPVRNLVANIKVFVSENGNVESSLSFPRRFTASRISKERIHTRATTDQQSIGGCLLISPGTSQITLQDIIVRGCRAESGAGLAVVNSNTVSLVRVSLIQNSQSNSSSSVGLAGGGGYFSNVTGVKIDSGNFSSNYFSSSGSGSVTGAALSFLRCTRVLFTGDMISISGNSATYTGSGSVQGGGIHIEGSQNVTFTAARMDLSRNFIQGQTSVSGVNGAGMYIANSVDVSIPETATVTFNGNRANLLPSANGFAGGGGAYLTNCNRITVRGTLGIFSNIVEGNAGNKYGGGLYMSAGQDIYFSSESITISNNSIVSVSNSGISGGGVYCFRLSNVVFEFGKILENSLATFGGIYFLGAGLRMSRCTSVTLRALEISRNSGISQLPTLTSTGTPPVYSADACLQYQPIQTQTGMLRNSNTYKILANCQWAFSGTGSVEVATLVYQVALNSVDIEGTSSSCTDLLSFYDGPTSVSPLIGSYCGTNGSVFCSSGMCPPYTNIMSTGGEMAVTFLSNGQVSGDGFSLTWKMVPRSAAVARANGVAGSSSRGIFGLPSSYGGGVHLYATEALIASCRISSNTVNSILLSGGGGIYCDTESKVTIRNSVLDQNVVVGAVAVGGGFACGFGGTYTFENTAIRNNTAVATGDCYYADKLIQCPASYGGGIFVQSLVATVGSNISDNSALCNSIYPCSAHGGGIAVPTATGVLRLAQSICVSNTVVCPFGSACVNGFGGCLYGDKGSARVENRTLVLFNTVIGLGGGGGACSAGSHTLSIFDTDISDNAAREGGGLLLTDTSTVSLYSSLLSRNFGSAIAGGIGATGHATLDIESSLLQQNLATRGSAILTFDDDGSATYRMRNTTIQAGVGSTVLMLGRIIANDTVIWNCSFPGSVYLEDNTSDFFSLQCTKCDEGTYTLESASTLLPRRACLPCPAGGICNGSSEVDNGLKSQPGFWGSADGQGEVTFHLCPNGHCCPTTSRSGCNFNYCDGGRVGVLCGSCEEGSGMRFFSNRCGLDSKCKDGPWAFIIVAIGALLFALFLSLTAMDHSTSTTLSLLLYFYQVLSLVKSTPWLYTSPALIQSLQSVFNMAPSGDSSNDGICLLKSMTARQKLSAQILFLGVVTLAFAPIYLLHQLLWKQRVLVKARLRPSRSTYAGAVTRFLTIAYTTLALVPLQMLQCTEIENRQVWWFDGEIECFQEWQYVALFFVVLLALLPVFVIVIMFRWKDKQALNRWRRSVRHVLGMGFRDERRWYLGVGLYRRLFLVFGYIITDLNWRALVISALCVAFLCLHLVLMPYKNEKNNLFEAVFLGILALLAISTAGSLAQIQFGSIQTFANQRSLEWAQFFLAIIPALVYMVKFGLVDISKIIIMYKRRRGRRELRGTVLPFGSGGLPAPEGKTSISSDCSSSLGHDGSSSELFFQMTLAAETGEDPFGGTYALC